MLSAEVSGVVTELPVLVGEDVNKGDTLVVLNCDDYELRLKELEAEKQSLHARSQFAVYQYERASKLLKSKSIPEEKHREYNAERMHLSAQMEAVDAQIKFASLQVSRCEIRAPFTGVVTQRLVSLGERVMPQTELIRLMDTEDLEVVVQIPVTLIGQFDYSDLNFVHQSRRYPLALRAIVPSIESRARHQLGRFQFKGKDRPLPDSFGELEITLAEPHIAAQWVVQRGDTPGIFISDNGKARFHPLPDALAGRPARISLPPDSIIILSGRHTLEDGEPVELKSEEKVSE